MNSLIIILIIAYFAACIHAGYYVGTRMSSFLIGFLYFLGSIFVTPLISIPLMKMYGGRF